MREAEVSRISVEVVLPSYHEAKPTEHLQHFLHEGKNTLRSSSMKASPTAAQQSFHVSKSNSTNY